MYQPRHRLSRVHRGVPHGRWHPGDCRPVARLPARLRNLPTGRSDTEPTTPLSESVVSASIICWVNNTLIIDRRPLPRGRICDETTRPTTSRTAESLRDCWTATVKCSPPALEVRSGSHPKHRSMTARTQLFVDVDASGSVVLEVVPVVLHAQAGTVRTLTVPSLSTASIRSGSALEHRRLGFWQSGSKAPLV